MSEQKRMGRPPNKESNVKKGNSTWKPANVLDLYDKEPGYRYRIIEKSARNISKKQREGWEILTGLNASKTSMETGYGRINEGSSLTSVMEGHDYVIGRIPEDVAQERDDYINQRTNNSVKGLTRQAKKDLGEGELHGSISLEQRGVRTVIE